MFRIQKERRYKEEEVGKESSSTIYSAPSGVPGAEVLADEIFEQRGCRSYG